MTVHAVSVLSALLLLCTVATSAPPAPKVSALRLHLFENKSGHLSDNLLASPDPGLWNSIAGPHAASSAMVVVEVSGQPSAAYNGRAGGLPRYTVRLNASERGRSRPLLDQQQPLPVLGENGKVYVAFMILPSGCTAVQLVASLVGPNAAPPVRAAVPMACGE